VRARFYHDLREVWYEPEPAARDTLLGVAHAYTGVLDEDEILHQVPHWMFTFTGSGTDLLTRALTIISSRPAVRARVEHEFAAAGSLDDPVCITRLHYLEACLREAGRLFPPVTRTFHRAPAGAVAGGYRIANDVEVLHYLPLFYRYADGSADTHQFRPERWLERDRARRPYPDIFLSGSRACPGQDLILFVCKAAAATLLDRGVVSHSSILSNDPMPLTFPGKEARFAYGSDHP
jgi:cytochrome P450